MVNSRLFANNVTHRVSIQLSNDFLAQLDYTRSHQSSHVKPHLSLLDGAH